MLNSRIPAAPATGIGVECSALRSIAISRASVGMSSWSTASAAMPGMYRCPANGCANCGVGAARSSTCGMRICDGSICATKRWIPASDSNRSPDHCHRGNRNTQPSVVKNTSYSEPDPRYRRTEESIAGKELLISAAAFSRVSGGSGFHCGVVIDSRSTWCFPDRLKSRDADALRSIGFHQR